MIPARLDSTRLPGKLMMDLNGSPVILSTLLNTIKTNLFDEVYVVTDSKEIYNYLIKHHKNILFSKENHVSGSDRIAEFAKNMQLDRDKLLFSAYIAPPCQLALFFSKVQLKIEKSRVPLGSKTPAPIPSAARLLALPFDMMNPSSREKTAQGNESLLRVHRSASG